MITCPSCGFNENPDPARFCAHCAAPLSGDAASPEPGRGQTLAANTVLQRRYTVTEKLSQGGMGAVYIAQDTKLFNRPCVVKEMLPFYTTDEERHAAERNFEREARTLANLRHAGIPQIYDYFIEEDRYYLVMELVEGEDLGKLLAKQGGPLAEKDVIGYGLQLARILAYLAGLNPPIIHRDIKPANILLERSTGQLKLVDFGIARASIRSERLDATASIIMGTRGYAPPEQYTGDATLATDIYALGATLHHLLTGRHPTSGGMLRSARDVRPEVSPQLDALLLEMVRFEPEQRPAAEQVKERLGRLSGTQLAATAFVMRNGVEVYSAGELVQACEQNPEAGRYHLKQGHLREWLLGQNRHDLADLAEGCVQSAPDDKVALEWFLRGIDRELPAPELALDEEVVDFGEVERGSRYSLLVPFRNRTRGYLVVATGSHAPWLTVETEYAGCYPGEQGQIQVTLDTRDMPPGLHARDVLELAWEQDRRRVPVRLAVLWPPGGQIEPEALDLGILTEGEPLPAPEFLLQNTGGSDWVGRVYTDTPWLNLRGGAFRIPSQGQMRLPVAILPAALAVGESHRGVITLVSNGGTQVATVAARVARRWYSQRARSRRWLAFAAPTLLSLAGLGFGMAYLATWLLGSRPALPALYNAGLGLLAWLLGLLVAGVFVPALDEIEDFYHGGEVALDLPVTRSRGTPALALIALAAAGGLVLGLFYQRTAAPGSSRALIALAGLIAGALAGTGAVAGSSDVLRGARPLPGLSWLARQPTVAALLRTSITALSLALLGAMAAGPQGASLVGAATGAWAGLLLTADSYPYWPARLHQVLAWLRPAGRIALAAYGLYLVVLQVVWGGTVPWTAWWWNVGPTVRTTLMAGGGIVALALGALAGLATHDEVGFEWRREVRRTGPLALVLLLAAAVIAGLTGRIVRSVGDETGLAWLAATLTLALVALLALGLSGRSRAVQRWLAGGGAKMGGWLNQFRIPEGAQGLVQRGTEPLRWLSGATRTSGHHPAMLAAAVLVSVQMAPVLGRLLGGLLWLLLIVAAVAGVIWWQMRRSRAGAGEGGAS